MSLKTLRESTANLDKARDTARREAILAIRTLEQALVRALGGDRLYNSPNLATANLPLYGYQVRTKDPGRSLSWRADKWSLVLHDSGRLVLAHRTRGDVSFYAPDDDELYAEDLPRVAETIECAIGRHIKKVNRRQRRYQRIAEFAARVAAVLDEQHEQKESERDGKQ